MGDLIRIGMDTSKSVFQLHGVNSCEEVVLRRRLGRKGMVAFFRKLEPTMIGIEACGGAHHWARLLGGFGHEVRLMAPQLVKPYVPRGKNDAADAAGLCEAMSRPTMRFVPVKTAEDQAALMLLGLREQALRSRTRVSNVIRGYAAEFGLCAAKGRARIEPLLARIADDQAVPELARELFALQGAELARLDGEIARLEDRLNEWHRGNEMSRRLAALRGVGPIGAAMLVLKTPDPHGFRSGRQFAAWAGLTPKDHSTAGRTRHGAITRAGDETLRAVLVAGATALIQQLHKGRSRPFPWLEELLARKPAKLAAVALANKTARMAWKLMVTDGTYEPDRAEAPG